MMCGMTKRASDEWPSFGSMVALLRQRLQVSVERVAFADEHVPPPFGRLDTRLVEHVRELAAKLGRHALEIGAHGIGRRFAGAHHSVADIFPQANSFPERIGRGLRGSKPFLRPASALPIWLRSS